jgi:hypothetical protein
MKLAYYIIAVLIFTGCASMNCGEPYGDAVWKSGHHAYFSMWGYKHPDGSDRAFSVKEEWNGCSIEMKDEDFERE